MGILLLTLGGEQALSGSLLASATISGTLNLSLSASVNATATVTGNLVLTPAGVTFAGSLVGTALVSGNLVAGLALNGSLTATATVVADLVAGSVLGLAGSVSATAEVFGSLVGISSPGVVDDTLEPPTWQDEVLVGDSLWDGVVTGNMGVDSFGYLILGE